jgi:hypothetical protein
LGGATKNNEGVMSATTRLTLSAFVAAMAALCGGWTVYENTIGPCSFATPRTTAAKPSAGALSTTALRALAAYGGETVWKNSTTTESVVTIGGALFLVKGRNIPAHAVVRADIRQPHVEITPIDPDGDIGLLDGFALTVRAPSGEIVEARADARVHLQDQQLWTKWDRLDLLYFLGYAFWGYNSLPYQLTRSDIKWTEIEDSVLQADYGPGVPVHSREQRFSFDPRTGLLKRNDYIAVAASPGAQAANVVLAHETSNGIPYPAERRVKITPVRYGWCLPAPDMVTIDVERWRIY